MKTLVNKVNKWFGGKQPSAGTGGDEKLVVVPRAEHGISRDDFSESALKVLYRLHNAGYQAYIVGGAVRDVMLGYHPKDFDVATDAKPEEIRKLFRNCRLIGRRFRLAHILFGREVIEVATFRAADSAKSKSEHGVILRDNTYGTVEEDAWRRDFSVNALYYNIADFSVYDYCGGIKDLKARQMRMIGDPEERYREGSGSDAARHSACHQTRTRHSPQDAQTHSSYGSSVGASVIITTLGRVPKAVSDRSLKQYYGAIA